LNTQAGGNILTGDVNGDKKSDLVQILNQNGNTMINAFLSNGTAFAFSWPTPFASNTFGNYYLTDTNGDGKADILELFPNSGNLGVNNIISGGPVPDMVASIQDALGAEATINYKSTADLSVYTPGTDAIYPNIDSLEPLQVVDSYAIFANGKQQKLVAFQYAKAQTNLLGDGFLGFASFSYADKFEDITTTETRTLLRPSTGNLIQLVKALTTTGTVISQIQHTWDVEYYSWGSYWNYIAGTESNSYELDGTLITNIKTNNKWDTDYAIKIAETQLVHWNSESHQRTIDNFEKWRQDQRFTAYLDSFDLSTTGDFQTTTEITYNNDPQQWLIGLVTFTQTTAIMNTQDPFVRSSSYEYYNETGILQKVIHDPETQFEKTGNRSETCPVN
jgi:hypothetical protein